MKPLINKKTQEYLDSKDSQNAVFYNNLDAIDTLIFEDGLRIRNLFFDKDLDLMVIILNNKKIIKRSISDFKFLTNLSQKSLEKFENDGFGLHWPNIDADLSLKGFLRDELARMDTPVIID